MSASELLSSDRPRLRPATMARFLAGLERRTRTAPARVVSDITELLTAARRPGNEALRARLHRARGHALRALARYPAALADYRRAITLYERRGDKGEAAVSRIGLVDALMYLARYDAAIAAASEARRYFVAAKDRPRQARIETNLGNIHHRRDRHIEALSWYDRARRQFVRLRDAPARALVDYNRGNVLAMLGRFAAARKAFESARKIYLALRLPPRVAQVDYGLAYLPYLENRLPEALEALAAVRVRLIDLGDRRHGALCRLDEAEILLRLNLWDDAALAATDALQGFEALRMSYEAAKARTFLGAASYRRGDLDLASRELRTARRQFLGEPNEIWGGEAELGLARLSIDRGRWGEAVRWAEGAERRLTRSDWTDGAGRAWLLRATAARGAGRPAEARRDISRALAEARRRGSDWLTSEAGEVAGLLALDRGEKRAARAHFVAAIGAVERLRSMLAGDDFRTAFHRHRDGAYVALAQLELREGRPREAFRALERGRARALLEGLAALGRGTPAGAKPPGRRSALRAKLRKQADKLLKELGERYHLDAVVGDRLRYAGQEGAPAAAESLERERLEAELARVMSHLGREAPGASLTEETDSESIRELLRPDETLFSWYELDGRLGCFRLDARGLESFPDLASAAEVAELVDRLRFQWGRFRLDPPLLERHATQLHRLARNDLGRLYDSVFRRVDPGGACRTLILVPTAMLRTLPFSALHDGSRFLAERYAMTVVPAAGVFRAGRLESGLSDPRHPARRLAAPRSALLVGHADARAPEIETEIRDLTARLPRVRPLVGRTATVAAFRAAAPRADLIHVASHGVFRSDRPSLSGLKLSDRWMYGYDVTSLRLKARLVTLSACRSGQSSAWGGGEWLGLARSFLAAGAQRVLAGLWDLDDLATRRLMNLFYKRWLAGEGGFATALSAAQSELASEGLHPYYWSGLALVGET